MLPLGLGIVAGRLTLDSRVETLLDMIGLGYIDRMPSAWEFVLRRPNPRYVRFQLKDGLGVVGGVFADHSFASINTARADIYLEQVWRLDEDGNFDAPVLDLSLIHI